MNCLIWRTISCWLGVSSCPAIFFRFASVAAASWSVDRCSSACSAVVSPVSWIAGSFDPPLRTTFLGVGQGGNEEPAAASAGLAASAEFPAAGAVAVEQFGAAVFLWRRAFAAAGLARAAEAGVSPVDAAAGFAGSEGCACALAVETRSAVEAPCCPDPTAPTRSQPSPR